MSSTSAYRRALLKLSGEAFLGEDQNLGIDPQKLNHLANEISEAKNLGVQLAIVIGGGNLFRGKDLEHTGFDRVTGDQISMLGTLINALALSQALTATSLKNRVLSSVPVGSMAQLYQREEAIRLLESGETLIFAGGTGNPLVTTDSAASLRSIEIGADIILKATQVDGIYSADPKKDSTAEKYDQITFDEVLKRELAVMDLSAFHQCRNHGMPIRIFNLKKSGMLSKVMSGEKEGSLVTI